MKILVIAAALVAAAIVATPAVSQETLRLELRSTDRTERAAELDLGRRGPSTGDRTIARGPVFDADRNRVGRYTAEIVTYNPRTLLTGMTVTLVLRDGQIVVGGSLPFRRTLSDAGAVLAVTGGTGAYAHARGTATMRAYDDGFGFSLEVAR